MFGGNVKVSDCDETAVNTGVNGGVCRLYGIVTSIAFHCLCAICTVMNSSSDTFYICVLYKTTSGPRSFSGQIGSGCAADVWTGDGGLLSCVGTQGGAARGPAEEPEQGPENPSPGRAEQLQLGHKGMPQDRTVQPHPMSLPVIDKLCAK